MNLCKRYILFAVIFGLGATWVAGCDFKDERTVSIVREAGVADWVNHRYWAKKNQAKTAIEEGRKLEREGNFSAAIGKYQRAYRLSPEESHLPLSIAKNYARIFAHNPTYGEFEKQKSLEWLYRAYWVDPSFDAAVFKDPAFETLSDEEVLKTLKRNFGIGQEREVLALLQRLTSMMQESQVVLGELKRGMTLLGDFFAWMGAPVLCLIFLTLLMQWIFFLVGFPRGWLTLICSFLLASGVWIYGNRILSAGSTTGVRETLKIMGGVFMLWVLLGALRQGMVALGRPIADLFLKGVQRLNLRVFSRRKSRVDVGARVVQLETLHQRFSQATLQYLVCQDPLEKNKLKEQLSDLWRAIHQETAKPL